MPLAEALDFGGIVVPRKGDVDRNPIMAAQIDRDKVVPRKGDVDRNYKSVNYTEQNDVVPRKGDVDRNFIVSVFRVRVPRSSPARGTWIEIHIPTCRAGAGFVVPRKGDVDRNCA